MDSVEHSRESSQTNLHFQNAVGQQYEQIADHCVEKDVHGVIMLWFVSMKMIVQLEGGRSDGPKGLVALAVQNVVAPEVVVEDTGPRRSWSQVFVGGNRS